MKNKKVGEVEEVEEEEAEVEEEEYTQMENEMIFCLEEDPDYQISAVGKWYENSHGEVIGDVDTYFLHIMTGSRCESVRDCFDGWSEPDEKYDERNTVGRGCSFFGRKKQRGESPNRI